MLNLFQHPIITVTNFARLPWSVDVACVVPKQVRHDGNFEEQGGGTSLSTASGKKGKTYNAEYLSGRKN